MLILCKILFFHIVDYVEFFIFALFLVHLSINMNRVYFVLSKMSDSQCAWPNDFLLKYRTLHSLSCDFFISDPLPGLELAIYLQDHLQGNLPGSRIIYFDFSNFMFFYYESDTQSLEK